MKLTRAKAVRGTRGSSSNMNKTEEQHEKETGVCVIRAVVVVWWEQE